MTEEIKSRLEQIRAGKVPEGYCCKWGTMPESWRYVSLGKLYSKSTKKNVGNAVSVAFTNSAVYGIIPQRDYFEKDIANSENTDGYYVVQPDDYIYNPRISESAPYGPFSKNNTGSIGIVSPLYTVLTPKDEYKDSKYLQYFFASTQWYKYAYSIANYGARFDRMNITDTDLLALPVVLPSGSEQQKIAEILMQCDKVITLKKERIEEEKKRKKWLMEKLLDPNSGMRLPGFEDSEWNTYALSEIADIRSGGTPDTSVRQYWNGDVFWCTPTDISRRGKYISDTAQSISREGLTASSAEILPVGTVLMCSRASIGPHTISAVPISTNQGFKNFICGTCLDNEFFYYYLDTCLNDFLRMSAGNTFKELSKSSLESYTVTIPDVREQIAIARILSAQDCIIACLEHELDQWQQKKKALLQLLLTGIARVKI